MKKKLLSGIFALALLATAGYGVNISMNSNVNLSDLTLKNVEALAASEQGDGWDCSPSTTTVCYWGSSGSVKGKFYWK